MNTFILIFLDVQLNRHYPCPKKHLTSTDLSISTISPIPSGLSREIKDCIHLCPATSEYSPVCGSDGRTYYNNGKLDCARHCGVGKYILFLLITKGGFRGFARLLALLGVKSKKNTKHVFNKIFLTVWIYYFYKNHTCSSCC